MAETYDHNHNRHHNTTTTTTTNTDNSATGNPSKMGAAKDKFVGGIKETIGTVVGAEGLKESGREQKREGDAEALAAGKGKKHYDPALARKGVGIQHKHMGPNPKKFTEGPCAGCKDGTCQVGHDYDAAICHGVTQGHCDAGNVKQAGLGTQPQAIHNHGHNHGGLQRGVGVVPCSQCTNSACNGCGGGYNNAGTVAHHQNIGGHHLAAGAIPAGHNTAYDAAACPQCTSGTCGNQSHGHGGMMPVVMAGHSDRDRAMMKKKNKQNLTEEDRALRRQEKERRRAANATGGGGHNPVKLYKHRQPALDPLQRADPGFTRDLDHESDKDAARLALLDAEDRRDMDRLAPKLHHCQDDYHRNHVSRGVHVCDVCGSQL